MWGVFFCASLIHADTEENTLKKTHWHTLTDSRHGLGGNMTAVPEGHISLYTETTDSVSVCVCAVFKAELQKDVPFF